MDDVSKPESITPHAPSPDSWRQAVLENALDAVIGVDEAGLIIHWNPASENLFGWNREEVLGRRMADVIYPPEDRERHPLSIQKASKAGGSSNGNLRTEAKAIHRSGHHFLIELTAIPIQEGSSQHIYSFIRDITDRRKNESLLEETRHSLQASQTLFSALFERAPFSTQLLAADGRTLMVNQAWKDFWGIPDQTVESYILKEYNVLTDPQLRQRGVHGYIERAFRGEAVQLPEMRYDPVEIGIPGRPRWTKGYFYPVKATDGTIQNVVLIHEDVTEQVTGVENQKFLSELYFNLTRLSEPEKMTAFAVKALGEHLGTSRCWMSEIDDPSAAAHVRQDFASGLPSLSGDYDLRSFGSQLLKSWRTGLMVTVDDVESDARTLADARSHLALGIRAFISVPLHRKGQMVAALNVSSDKPRRWTLTEADLTRSVAETLWSSIEKARLYQEAQEAVRARDEFISICSHELKTPLTSMKLQFQLAVRQIEKGEPSALSREVIERRLNTSSRQLDRMTSLIDEMLDVSRIATGKLQMNVESIDLCELTQEVIERFMEQVTLLGVALTFDSEPARAMVKGDRYRLEQVISNLLTNAVKYGSGKPIQVSLEVLAGRVRLQVKDQGIGIESENLERIFERFERAVPASNISGLGLGLYISRQIVEMHGGKIWAESQPGKGSTFSVELPLLSPA